MNAASSSVAERDGGRLDNLTVPILDHYARYPELISSRPSDALGHLRASAVASLIDALRALIFPGFFGNPFGAPALVWNDATPGVLPRSGKALESLAALLHEQISSALASGDSSKSAQNITKDAWERVYAFLEAIPALRQMLATDVDAAFEGDPAASCRAEIILAYPGVYAITVHRLAHRLYELSIPILPRMMSEYAHSQTGIDIHPGAKIGPRFFIDHGTGVVIGETSHIGERVKIYQGVTLGALSTRGGRLLSGQKRHPTLENDVTIYSGASILGGGTVIGEGAVIGSNVFITQSVPARTRVSVKDPELQFMAKKQESNVEFKQNVFWDYVI
ncbi:MAG: serine acetyltransferase [Azoarcus sp.]|jgi:serine O-acetyltransferase|nr:serine acetyltransferase [Azoarcus sp.]